RSAVQVAQGMNEDQLFLVAETAMLIHLAFEGGEDRTVTEQMANSRIGLEVGVGPGWPGRWRQRSKGGLGRRRVVARHGHRRPGRRGLLEPFERGIKRPSAGAHHLTQGGERLRQRLAGAVEEEGASAAPAMDAQGKLDEVAQPLALAAALLGEELQVQP